MNKSLIFFIKNPHKAQDLYPDGLIQIRGFRLHLCQEPYVLASKGLESHFILEKSFFSSLNFLSYNFLSQLEPKVDLKSLEIEMETFIKSSNS